VFVPLPQGLIRVYNTKGGDVGYEFDTHEQAKSFNHSIKDVGTIDNSSSNKNLNKRVYLGRKLAKEAVEKGRGFGSIE
jgi:hypothetical protein